jgi:hypothetical protein
LIEIARRAPASERELAGVPGMKRWQVDAVGAELLSVLAR